VIACYHLALVSSKFGAAHPVNTVASCERSRVQPLCRTLQLTLGMLTAVTALVSPKPAAAREPYSGRPMSRPDRAARMEAQTSSLN
jgi:hypothetical protein